MMGKVDFESIALVDQWMYDSFIAWRLEIM